MDEKKQESIQSSSNQELNAPEENQNNNTESITSEAASGTEGQEQSETQKTVAPGQKSGINKKVVGAAAFVVAAVVGGAVYMTQQSHTDGMWSNGKSSSESSVKQHAPEPQSASTVAVPDATQNEVQPEAGQEQTANSAIDIEAADVPLAQSDSDSNETAVSQPAKPLENDVPVAEAHQAESASSEESALTETGVPETEAPDAGELAQSSVNNTSNSTTPLKEVNATNESDMAGAVKAQLDEQTAQITQLKAELQQMQKQYTELLEQRVSRADVDVSLFVVNDVARLVQSADNELSIAGNLPNAIRALEMAQQTIQRANSPILSGLAGAVSSDIVMLKSAPVMNEGTLFKEVDKLMALLDKAPLVSPDQVGHLATVLPNNAAISQSAGQDTQATSGQALSWYEKAWEEIKSWPSEAMGLLKSDLGGLVRVEKLDDPTVALISTGQAAALKNNLKLDLRFAQQGLLNAQQGIWTSSLESVQAALLKYYNQDAPETRNALELTRNLLTIPVRPQLPQITHSIKAIEETRNQIVNLANPQE